MVVSSFGPGSGPTGTISLMVYLGIYLSGICIFLYMAYNYDKRIEMENFPSEFLKMENKKREKLLNKYMKGNYISMRSAIYTLFSNHYDKISPETRENLLKYMLKEEDTLTHFNQDTVLSILDKHFDIIPQHLHNEIISQILPTAEGWEKAQIAEILVANFEKYDKNFRNDVLLKVIDSSNEDAKFQIAEILNKNFNDIPLEISKIALQELMESDEKENKEYAMEILFKNFYKIDIFTRDKLLTEYVRYGADKSILNKFLSTYPNSINPEIEKRMIEFVSKTK